MADDRTEPASTGNEPARVTSTTGTTDTATDRRALPESPPDGVSPPSEEWGDWFSGAPVEGADNGDSVPSTLASPGAAATGPWGGWFPAKRSTASEAVITDRSSMTERAAVVGGLVAGGGRPVATGARVEEMPTTEIPVLPFPPSAARRAAWPRRRPGRHERVTPEPTAFDRRAVEAWFRRRGLPLFVRSDERASRLLQRAVPALVFLLVIDPITTLVTWLVDVPQAEFQRRMTNTAYVFPLLALIVAGVVVPVLAGWLVSLWMRRLPRRGRWWVARVVLLLNVLAVPLVDWSSGLRDNLWLSLAINVGVTLLMLFFVWVGAGSILAWGLRKAVAELGTVGRMATTALPLLVIVVIFSFFATEVWQIAAALPRWRLWLVVALFALLGVLFMASRLSDELRKMIDRVANDKVDDLANVLRHTPLAAAVAGPPIESMPLGRRERANITLVLFVAQLLQILLLSVLVFCVLIALGALAVDSTVIDSWLGPGAARREGTLFGAKLPLSAGLVQVSLFLAAFSGVYFAASAATDQHYRESFFEPLLADVRTSLAARQVYLAPRPDAS
ncbi:hypothetical protein [Actinophytocola sp.]|uniref:hypothetical protein n=1 Tax=Actinophytocola sp. TaxID=1872138 RepID=UPI00389AAE45